MVSKPKPPSTTPKPTPGYLYCDGCAWAVPFYGPAGPWPLHRCRGRVGEFSRWSVEKPPFPSAPNVADTA